jgi:hypothetical protein
MVPLPPEAEDWKVFGLWAGTIQDGRWQTDDYLLAG